LAPYPPGDVLSDLAAVVAAETVDLGGDENDEDGEILGELAAVMAAVLVDEGLGR